jgi:hypothetical protein
MQSENEIKDYKIHLNNLYSAILTQKIQVSHQDTSSYEYSLEYT